MSTHIPSKSNTGPEVIILEKQDGFGGMTQETKQEAINNLLQSSQFLARKLGISDEEEKRILELVDLSLEEIQVKNIIAQLEKKGITNSKIILTLLVQNNQACIMTIEGLLKNGLIKKLDEATFIALLDFPFGIQLIHDTFQGKSLTQIMEDQRKIFEENKEVSREVLRKEYNHQFIDIDRPEEKITQNLPTIKEPVKNLNLSPKIFDNLGEATVFALFERGMNEIVRRHFNEFKIDNSIKSYLQKLKTMPSFQEASEKSLEIFEQKLHEISKQIIGEKYEGVMDVMVGNTQRIIHKFIKSLKEGGSLVVPSIVFLTLIGCGGLIGSEHVTGIPRAGMIIGSLFGILFILAESAIFLGDTNKKDLIAQLKRRDIINNDTSVGISTIDEIAKDLLPGSQEYKEFMEFKKSFTQLDVPQATISPSQLNFYKEGPTLFFTHTITPLEHGITKLGSFIADHMVNSNDALNVMALTKTMFNQKLSIQEVELYDKDLIKINSIIQDIIKEQIYCDLGNIIPNINTIEEFEELYCGYTNQCSEKYMTLIEDDYILQFFNNESELSNTKVQKKFAAMTLRISKNANTLPKIEKLLNHATFWTKCVKDSYENSSNNSLKMESRYRLRNIKEDLINKINKLCKDDKKIGITTYNAFIKRIEEL